MNTTNQETKQKERSLIRRERDLGASFILITVQCGRSKRRPGLFSDEEFEHFIYSFIASAVPCMTYLIYTKISEAVFLYKD